MMAGSKRPARLLAPALGAVLVAAAGLPGARAQHAPVPFENAELGYAVALPGGCRHVEGPGTLEAVCTPDLDPEKSATAPAASSLVLEIIAEPVPSPEDKPPAALAQDYGESRFRDSLPEGICGEADKPRVKIDNVRQSVESDRAVFSADVICPEIKFLQLGERRARVQLILTSGVRYRLMARAQQDDFATRKDTVDAFFSSFRLLPEKKSQ